MLARGLCLLVLLTLTTQAHARPRSRRQPYTLELLDAHGKRLDTYEHRGTSYALGEYGERYRIRVRNHTAVRVEAVITVDGRDAISGRLGDYRNERGYVIAPYGRLTIDGFRTSTREVATFRFTEPSDSYSARMGSPQHVGIIGVAVFPERPRPEPAIAADRAPAPKAGAAPQSTHKELRQESSRSAAASSSGADAPKAEAEAAPKRRARQNNLGTEYGEARVSHVSNVHFVRKNGHNPEALLTLRYDNREGLLARGIQLPPDPRTCQASEEPQAFPLSRFAPPPPAR